MLGPGDGFEYISLPSGGNGPIVLAEVAGGVVWIFLSSFTSLFLLPFSERRHNIDLNISLKEPFTPNQPSN